MLLIYTLLCLTVVFQTSSSGPAKASKPKAVDLEHSCMSVISKKGEKEKSPILLLHGLGFSKEAWTGVYQILALLTGRRVCIADLRNHGDSPWSDESDIEAMAADIPQLLTTLKIPKVIVIGHSLGGKVAIHFTLNNPDKVEKLVVEDMRPNGITPRAMTEITVFLGLLQNSTSAIPEGATKREAQFAAIDYMIEELAKVNLTGVLSRVVALVLPLKKSNGKWDWKTNTELISKVLEDPLSFLTESSGRFDGPALFMYGTKSVFKIKEDESNILQLFPKAKLVAVEGAGHLVHDRPEFMTSVIKFIKASE